MKSAEYYVRQFEESCVAQISAIKEGNIELGNKHAKRYGRAFEALRALGDPGRDALVPLMRHPQPEVREMAAVCLLRYRHAEARTVLQELSKGEGLVAFGAGQALKRWDEGTWQLDPE